MLNIGITNHAFEQGKERFGFTHQLDLVNIIRDNYDKYKSLYECEYLTGTKLTVTLRGITFKVHIKEKELTVITVFPRESSETFKRERRKENKKHVKRLKQLKYLVY